MNRNEGTLVYEAGNYQVWEFGIGLSPDGDGVEHEYHVMDGPSGYRDIYETQEEAEAAARKQAIWAAATLEERDALEENGFWD